MLQKTKCFLKNLLSKKLCYSISEKFTNSKFFEILKYFIGD